MWNALDNYLSSVTRKRIMVGLFFGGYLLVGGWIFDDYGISFDEDYSRRNGIINYNYILKRDNFAALHDYSDKYYGPAFNILLVGIEDKLPAHSSKTLYLVRHFVTFLTFYAGVWVFYLLGKERFRSWKAGLLGSLLLILSPRVFADSFYNPKDLPFLSLFIISIYTLLRYLQTKSWKWTLLHALVCGVLVDIRVMGILVPALTCLFGLADALIGTTHPKVSPQRGIVSVFLYSLAFMGFTILLFPVLWENPFYHFTQAFLHMKRYPWPGTVLYLGEYIKATQLPWHYAPVWIGVTTPLAYLVFCLGGMGLTVISLIRHASSWFGEKSCRYDVTFLLWACCPLVAVIIFKSVLYGRIFCQSLPLSQRGLCIQA